MHVAGEHRKHVNLMFVRLHNYAHGREAKRSLYMVVFGDIALSPLRRFELFGQQPCPSLEVSDEVRDLLRSWENPAENSTHYRWKAHGKALQNTSSLQIGIRMDRRDDL